MTDPRMHAGFQWDYVFDWTIMKYQHQQPRIPPALESAQREVRRTPQDEERERHGSSFNRAGAPAEGSRRRCASLTASLRPWRTCASPAGCDMCSRLLVCCKARTPDKT